MKKLTISLLFILATISVFATNYYVDMSQGNDNWDGTSPATAFKTIEKVNDLTLYAGDFILFKRGEIWSGTRLFIEDIVATTNSNIVYAAYGTGAKPIISSVLNHPHTWTNIGSNIWKATNPPAEHPERLLINGAEKLRANIQSELDGVTYFWRYDDSTNDLYLYSTTDPNNFTIGYSTDFPIIIGYSSNITLRDIDVQGGWTGIFINTKSKNITLDSMNIGKYCREGVIINSDSSIPSDFPENIIVKNCNFDSQFAFDYSSASEYDGSFDRGSSDGIRSEVLNNGEISNCYFKNWGHASISLSGGSGLKVSNVSVNNNYLTSPDICYGGRMNADESTNCEFFNNQIINTSVQSQLNGQNNHYHHNIFRGTTNTPLITTVVDAGIEVQAYDETQIFGNIYEHNLITDTEGPGFRISGNNEQSIHNIIFRNNILYNCGTTVNGKSIVVEENEFEQTIDNSFLSNLVYSSTTNLTIDFRGIVYDVSGFNALTGTDGYVITNNLFDDPLFVEYTNEDYHLQSSSPCIDAGVTSLSLLDYEGNPIPYSGTLPDIGILEYQDVLAIDILSPLSATAKKEYVLLKWSTTIEKSNKGFEIQKSSDAINWKNMGWTKGNNNEGKSYHFIDNNPTQGIIYYRYKQIDFNDRYQYSNVVSVDFHRGKVRIFPNPTSSILNIVSDSNEDIEEVVIYNQLGLKVSQRILNQNKIDVSDVPKGLYFLELNNISKSDKYWFIKLE